MKKLLLVATAAIFLAAQGMATEPELFDFDKAAVNAAMSDLNQVENFVLQNEGMTLSQMEQDGVFERTNLVKIAPLDGASIYGEPPLGIPSFLWGCIFGVVGLAIVYFIAEDAEETKKALYGCIVGTVVSVVLYFVWWAAWFGGTTWY